MNDISAREFGRMQGDVDAIKSTLDQHTKLLEKLDLKLDGLVTYNEFEKHLEWGDKSIELLDKRIKALDKRIKALEKQQELNNASLWEQVKLAVNGNFVKFVGWAIFIIFGTLIVRFFITQYGTDKVIENQGVERGSNE